MGLNEFPIPIQASSDIESLEDNVDSDVHAARHTYISTSVGDVDVNGNTVLEHHYAGKLSQNESCSYCKQMIGEKNQEDELDLARKLQQKAFEMYSVPPCDANDQDVEGVSVRENKSILHNYSDMCLPEVQRYEPSSPEIVPKHSITFKANSLSQRTLTSAGYRCVRPTLQEGSSLAENLRSNKSTESGALNKCNTVAEIITTLNLIEKQVSDLTNIVICNLPNLHSSLKQEHINVEKVDLFSTPNVTSLLESPNEKISNENDSIVDINELIESSDAYSEVRPAPEDENEEVEVEDDGEEEEDDCETIPKLPMEYDEEDRVMEFIPEDTDTGSGYPDSLFEQSRIDISEMGINTVSEPDEYAYNSNCYDSEVETENPCSRDGTKALDDDILQVQENRLLCNRNETVMTNVCMEPTTLLDESLPNTMSLQHFAALQHVLKVFQFLNHLMNSVHSSSKSSATTLEILLDKLTFRETVTEFFFPRCKTTPSFLKSYKPFVIPLSPLYLKEDEGHDDLEKKRMVKIKKSSLYCVVLKVTDVILTGFVAHCGKDDHYLKYSDKLVILVVNAVYPEVRLFVGEYSEGTMMIENNRGNKEVDHTSEKCFKEHPGTGKKTVEDFAESTADSIFCTLSEELKLEDNNVVYHLKNDENMHYSEEKGHYAHGKENKANIEANVENLKYEDDGKSEGLEQSDSLNSSDDLFHVSDKEELVCDASDTTTDVSDNGHSFDNTHTCNQTNTIKPTVSFGNTSPCKEQETPAGNILDTNVDKILLCDGQNCDVGKESCHTEANTTKVNTGIENAKTVDIVEVKPFGATVIVDTVLSVPRESYNAPLKCRKKRRHALRQKNPGKSDPLNDCKKKMRQRKRSQSYASHISYTTDVTDAEMEESCQSKRKRKGPSRSRNHIDMKNKKKAKTASQVITIGKSKLTFSQGSIDRSQLTKKLLLRKVPGPETTESEAENILQRNEPQNKDSGYMSEISDAIDCFTASLKSLMDSLKSSNIKDLGKLEKDLKKSEAIILNDLNHLLSDWTYFRPESDNVTVAPGLQDYFKSLENGQPPSHEEQMEIEWLRVGSFSGYRGRGSSLNLARNGFYHDPNTGSAATRCVACNAEYSGWEYTTNVDAVHRRMSPNCPFVTAGQAHERNVSIVSADASVEPQNVTRFSAPSTAPIVQCEPAPAGSSTSGASMHVTPQNLTAVPQSLSAVPQSLTASKQNLTAVPQSQPSESQNLTAVTMGASAAVLPASSSAITPSDGSSSGSFSSGERSASAAHLKKAHVSVPSDQNQPASSLKQPTEDADNSTLLRSNIFLSRQRNRDNLPRLRAGQTSLGPRLEERRVQGQPPGDPGGTGAPSGLPRILTEAGLTELASKVGEEWAILILCLQVPLETIQEELAQNESTSASIATTIRACLVRWRDRSTSSNEDKVDQLLNALNETGRTELVTFVRQYNEGSTGLAAGSQRYSGSVTGSRPTVELQGENDPRSVYVEAPKYSQYTSLDVRISSFKGWPAALNLTAKKMAEAGFFYAGVADFTRCFACGGGLRNWESGDDPCMEHTRWFSHCEYMKKLKGEVYVTNIRRRQENHLAAQQRDREEQERRNAMRSGTQAAVDTDAGRTLVTMGYPAERITRVIETLRRQTGNTTVSADQAIRYILEEDENGGSSSMDNRSGAGTPQTGQPSTATVTTTQSSSGSARGSNKTTAAPPTAAASSHPVARTRTPPSAVSSRSPARGQTQSSEQKSSGSPSRAEAGQEASTGGKNGKKKKKKKGKGEESKESATSLGATNDPVKLDPKSLQEENERLRDMQICKVCMDKPVDTTLLPCGHLVLCHKCAPKVNLCPICRMGIQGTVRTYLS